MKKAFKPRAVVSLLADGNRDLESNHYRCDYLCIYHYLKALFNQIIGLLKERYLVFGTKKNKNFMVETEMYSLNLAVRIHGITGERNTCFELIVSNKHTISYQNIK